MRQKNEEKARVMVKKKRIAIEAAECATEKWKSNGKN